MKRLQQSPGSGARSPEPGVRVWPALAPAVGGVRGPRQAWFAFAQHWLSAGAGFCAQRRPSTVLSNCLFNWKNLLGLPPGPQLLIRLNVAISGGEGSPRALGSRHCAPSARAPAVPKLQPHCWFVLCSLLLGDVSRWVCWLTLCKVTSDHAFGAEPVLPAVASVAPLLLAPGSEQPLLPSGTRAIWATLRTMREARAWDQGLGLVPGAVRFTSSGC